MQPCGTSHIAYSSSETDPSKYLHTEYLYVPRLTNQVATLGAFILAVKTTQGPAIAWVSCVSTHHYSIPSVRNGEGPQPIRRIDRVARNQCLKPKHFLSFEEDSTRRAKELPQKHVRTKTSRIKGFHGNGAGQNEVVSNAEYMRKSLVFSLTRTHVP